MEGKPVIRTWSNCYFRSKVTDNNCSILRDEYVCQPTLCKWHRTKEEYIYSLYKAACNYEKATGKNDYHVKFVPMVLRNDFLEYKDKMNQTDKTDE